MFIPFRTGIAAVLVPLFMCALPAVSQQRDTTQRADTVDRPFVRGGVYDKPFLTRLGGRTAIGGYAEAHARWEHVDGAREESGFEAKRFNIFTNTRVSDFVRIGAELEFEDGGSEIRLEYAAIDLMLHPSLTLRAGMLLSPLGKFNLSHDSPLNEFTDRPLVSTEVLGVALSEPGLGVLGQFPFGRNGRLTYELYGTNGFHEGLILDSEDGTRIPLGRGNLEDNNGSPAVVGRLALSPQIGYEVGVSAHHGAYNVFESEGIVLDARRDLTIIAVDFEARVLALQVNGEGAIAELDLHPGLTGIYASRQRGFHVDAALPFGRDLIATMPGSYFAAKARLDVVDFDTDREGHGRSRVTVGLNFRPTEDTVLKLDYGRGRSRDEFNNLSEHAILLFSIATYF